MARKRATGRKRRSRFQAIPVNANLALTTLADTVVLGQVLTALSQDAWAISAKLTYALRGLTAGQGPLRVVLFSNDLSVAEVGEALDASPVSESDRVARERASRPVRQVGMFAGDATEETLNDGKPISTKLNWAIANSSEINMGIRNESGAPLTTGAVVEVNGFVFINWR